MIPVSKEIHPNQECFDQDPYPGEPKILFIGIPYSSHTLSWINLLQGEHLNIRTFSVGDGYPPDDWLFKIYLTTRYLPRNLNTSFRSSLYPTPEERDLSRSKFLFYTQNSGAYIKNKLKIYFFKMMISLSNLFNIDSYSMNTQKQLLEKKIIEINNEWKNHEIKDIFGEFNKFTKEILSIIFPKLFPVVVPRNKAGSEMDWLAHIINVWKPDIIHTLGFTPATDFFYETINKANMKPDAKWVLQARGSPDLSLHQHIPEKRERDQIFLQNCNVLIADNYHNYGIARELGIRPEKIAPFGIVPGSGGIDVDTICSQWSTPPSKRKRIIYIPKFYNGPYNKISPVIEALILTYNQIAPVEIFVSPEASDDIKNYFYTFPREFQNSFRWLGNISRQQVINNMMQARVMLAPSLSDGIPNVYYEAAACGTFPILSPIESITQLISAEKHALFARNLYPNEIAVAILRAMNDDILVDSAVANNLSIVYEYADSKKIKEKIVNFYRSLV